MTHREIEKWFDCDLPEYIIGAKGNRVRFLDATYPDFKAWLDRLERRIARRERMAKRRSSGRTVRGKRGTNA